MNPEFVLAIPHAAAEHDAGAEHGSLGRQGGPLPYTQKQPVADEFLDLHGHTEEMLENVRQPFGIPHLGDECAHVKELREVRHRVATAKRRRRHPKKCSDVGREAIFLRPIPVDVRLRLGPGPVEEREEPVMKDIEKAAERRIARKTQPLPRVFREVQRQGAVGPEQPEQPHLEPRRPAAAGLERGQRRGRKRQIGILPQPHRFVDRTERFSPTRLPVVQAFQPAQRLVEVVSVRRLCQGREEG